MKPTQVAVVIDDDAARGRLVATELTTIPFPVKRVFFVSAPGQPVTRGGHATTCDELICLISGSALIRTSVTHDHVVQTTEHLLSRAGDSCVLSEGTFIEYELQTPTSEIVVFASDTFQPIRSERITSDD